MYAETRQTRCRRNDACTVQVDRRVCGTTNTSGAIVCCVVMCVIGSYACIRAYFHLERRLRAYILSTYLPSMLVVLLSWVSFWIDLESVPARISLGILTMLTITTQSSGQGRFPAVSFTKAIDIWMSTCDSRSTPDTPTMVGL